jgi:hypothetical protein
VTETIHDPAVVVDWHFDVIQRFVEGAMTILFFLQPHFITTAPGNMMVTSLINNIMMRLGSVSCGRNGNNLLAPNTHSQFGNILQVL